MENCHKIKRKDIIILYNKTEKELIKNRKQGKINRVEYTYNNYGLITTYIV